MTSSLSRCSDFSQSSRGILFNRLLIGSLAASTISFGLSMGRFAFASVFVIPSAFAVTLIHHIVIWCRLAKYKKQTTTPQCPTPPFLKHAGHIWPLLIFGLTWFAGGITAICVIAVNYSYGYDTMMALDVVDIISGTFALIEGVIMMTILGFCWRSLSREGYNGVQCSCGNTHPAGGSMGIPMNDIVNDAASCAPAYEGGVVCDTDSLKKAPI